MWVELSSGEKQAKKFIKPATTGSTGEGATSQSAILVSEAVVNVASSDCGIAWNPFMKQYPVEKHEWIFATASAPSVVARKLTRADTPRQFCLVHTESVSSQLAVDEILEEISIAGALQNQIAAISGGSLIEACAFVVSAFEKIFPAFVRTSEPLAKLHIRLISNVTPPPPQSLGLFECISLEDRVLSVLASRGEALPSHYSFKEESLSEVSPEIVDATESAMRSVAMSETCVMIIFTGSIGAELKIAVSKLSKMVVAVSGIEPLIVDDRSFSRVRAGFESEISAVTTALKNKRKVIVAAATPRRSDRELFATIAKAVCETPNQMSSIVAWVTRPGWWMNDRNLKDPEMMMSLRANSALFVPPDRDGSSLLVARIV